MAQFAEGGHWEGFLKRLFCDYSVFLKTLATALKLLISLVTKSGDRKLLEATKVLKNIKGSDIQGEMMS